MKKNFMALFMAMILMVISLAACGGEGQSGKDSTTAAAQNGTEAPELQPGLMEDVQTVISDTEGVKYESENIVIEISPIDYIHYSGAGIDVTCENKTDKKLWVDSDDLLWLNGYQTWGSVDFALEPGEKKTTTCSLLMGGYNELLMSDIGEVVFYYQLHYDGSVEMFEKVKVGYRTENYAQMDTRVGKAPQKLYEKDGLTVTAEFVTAGVWENCLVLYIENQMGRDVAVMSDDTTLNGEAVSGVSFGYRVYKDGKAIYYVPFPGTGTYKVGDVIEMNIELVDPVTFEYIAEPEAANKITIKSDK